MSLGSIWLQLQIRYGKGLRVAWARDRIRPRILNTAPCPSSVDGPIELHVLTSKGDWLNLIWSLKSFFFYTKRNYPICIHEDGSLTDEAKQTIHFHFPDARLIERNTSDSEMHGRLEKFPLAKAFRQNNPLAIKVFDFSHYLQSDRMFLFDSDLIFFDYPQALIQRLENREYALNSVNRDITSAYNADPADVLTRYNIQLIQRFNSGLGIIHKASMNWDWFEEFLTTPGIAKHHWRIEQTLFALASSRFGTELLPPEYDVYRGPRQKSFPVRHYVGEIRHLMYSEGMAELKRRGFLKFF